MLQLFCSWGQSRPGRWVWGVHVVPFSPLIPFSEPFTFRCTPLSRSLPAPFRALYLSVSIAALSEKGKTPQKGPKPPLRAHRFVQPTVLLHPPFPSFPWRCVRVFAFTPLHVPSSPTAAARRGPPIAQPSRSTKLGIPQPLAVFWGHRDHSEPRIGEQLPPSPPPDEIGPLIRSSCPAARGCAP